MKEYPSILGVNKNPAGFGRQCIAFDKIDGSNLRWEYNTKKGWTSKFGSRTQLFDKTHEVFGCSIDMFFNTMSGPLEEVFKKDKLFRNCSKITVYTEFFGAHSFAGTHVPEDPKILYLLDVWIDRKGFINPNVFLDLFNHLNIPKVIYKGSFNKEFVQAIKSMLYGYHINEGIVAKGVHDGAVWMVKVKTNAYLDKLKTFGYNLEEYGE